MSHRHAANALSDAALAAASPAGRSPRHPDPRRSRGWRGLSASALAIGLAAGLTLGPTPVRAEPPAVIKEQVPGYYRQAIGDVVVTALYDGFIDLPTKVLKGISAADAQSLLARMFLATTPGVQTAVNGFLIHTGKHLVLVDTGAASNFGPNTGNILNNLKAAGYRPEDVDTVLLTHLHADHASGLVAEGRAAFPNAEVLVNKADADYWLSDANLAKAPEQGKPFFQMARAAVAPYQANGRLRTFAPGDTLVEGITAVPAYGHTPGHTGYLIRSGKQSMLLWGDIVHSHSVQFQRPQVTLEFDVDQPRAIETRKRLMADAAKNRLWVAGAHLPFPGIGHVRADGQHYAWVPVEFGPIRSQP